MTIKLYSTILLLGLLTVSSCKKQGVPPQFHYDYFDLTPGRFIVYDVVEIHHDEALAINETLYYQLKTLIGDTIIDNEGRVARKFQRYKRNTASDPWVLSDIWTTIIADNRAELVEENQRVIKLVFAPTISKEWNPNAFNMQQEQLYYYENIHDPITIGGISFDSSLVVVQEDNEPNLVEYKKQYEVYAKGVGLVYKFYKDLEISGFDTLNIDKGEELFYTVRNFGIE